MDFLGKDKLARLDEEKQQRRKARAEEAQKRLAEVGKQTQQMVSETVMPNRPANVTSPVLVPDRLLPCRASARAAG